MIKDFLEKFKVHELLIHESEYWRWSLRPHQVTLGAGILSLKRECPDLGKLNREEFTDLDSIIKVIEPSVKTVLNCDIVNYFLLMMVDRHVHYHVVPRYKNQVIFLDKVWIDQQWPKTPDLTHGAPENTEVLKKIKEKLHKIIFFGETTNTELNVKKYDIGYTTGVFDMFHIGHLNILRKAKENCKKLIVGVSTDEVVKSYKNKTPIISFKERMEIVKSVRFVDEAVPQYSMDKFSAWEKYRFNVIFHGDDWKGSKMYEEIEKKFKDVGVELVFFPHTEGTSSTKLRDVLDRFTNK